MARHYINYLNQVFHVLHYKLLFYFFCREIAGCSTVIPDGIAEATLAAFAYFSTSWQMYLFGFSLLSIVFAFLVLLLPESPRWLIANGRVEEAVEVIVGAAKRYILHKTALLKQHSMNVVL